MLASNFPEMSFAVPTGIDASYLDFDIIDHLKKADFHHLFLGIETGDLDIQKTYVDKRINLKEMKEKIKYLKDAGISTFGSFLLGFPGETRDQIHKTVDLATSLDLDRIYLIMLTPLPGSELYDYCIENNLLYEDFDPTEIHYSNTFIKNPNISRKELEDIRKNVWREYMSVKIDLKDYNERGWASTL